MVDVSTLSLAELKQLRSDIDAALARAQKREIEEARDKVMAIAHGFNMPLDTFLEHVGLLGGKKGVIREHKMPKAAGPKIERYRNPNDHRQTWSGRGRKPDWVRTSGLPIEALENPEFKAPE